MPSSPEPLEPESRWKTLQAGGTSVHFEETIKVEDDVGFFNQYSLRKELIPYLPYVDKAAAKRPLEAQESLPVSLKHSEWIDINVIRSWIKTCNKYHKDHCLPGDGSPMSPWHGPLWLIDGLTRRLVPAEPGMKYFALSYVWGPSKSVESEFCLITSNLEWIQEEGSLRNRKDRQPVLPKLIDDVIEFVVRLSWRYVWIDRYCIVQDDGPAKDAQINSMDSIYAGAYATIVAAQGDASSGLRGIKGQSDPRGSRTIMDHVTHTRFQSSLDEQGGNKAKGGWGIIRRDELRSFQDSIRELSIQNEEDEVGAAGLSRASSVDSFDSFVISDGTRQRIVAKQQAQDRKMLESQAYLLMHSPWYSRGWTFQEALFSRRKIVFQNDTVNWECHCVAWYEGQESIDSEAHGPCIRRPAFSMEIGFDSAPWPDLYRYARLVCLFNRRLLTYPEDALFAFAGVTSALACAFMYGFISGLPQMFFLSALMWQPYGLLVRRQESNSKSAVLPSWSWAGWQGVLQYESWRSGYGYIKSLATEKDLEPTTWQTFETVKWYRLDNTGAKHEVKCIGEKAARDRHPPKAGAGWTSDLCSKTGRAIFRHKSVPDTDFWYPVPLRDPIKAHIPPMYCRHLATRTWRTFAKAGGRFQAAASSRCAAIDLTDEKGQWIGVLRLPSAGVSSKIYEVIELSAGSVEKQDTERVCFDEWDRPGLEQYWVNGKYDFINVMAITWADDIAYREAVGRVAKSSWESLEKDLMDVLVG